MDRISAGKRLNIQAMLGESLKIEYPFSKPGQVLIRYYHMTEAEYEQSKGFTLTVVMGKNPKENNITEGFCFDVRTLLRERYFTLDGNTSFIPIPLSVQRWNYLIDKVPPEQFKLHYREMGLLEYPLTHQELITIFDKMPFQPIICSVNDYCLALSDEESLRLSTKTVRLFDPSEDTRFGPKRRTTSTVVPNINSKKELDEKTQRIIEQVKKTLQDIEIMNTNIMNKLTSNETKIYIQSMLMGNLMEQHVVSFLIDDAIKLVLSGRNVS